MRQVYLRQLDRRDADPDYYKHASQRRGDNVDEGVQNHAAVYEGLQAAYEATYRAQR